jgi:DNA processing protein
MTPFLSPNTQAILLLTAPLIAGRSSTSQDLLSPGEYKRLARHLREIQRQPADLISQDSAEIIRACGPVIEGGRLQRLLARGFLLSQVIERWQARAIWVVSRADAEYPRRLKGRLREDAPAVLYGCGDISLLETGGLAVVGSRHVDDTLIEYTMDIGRLASLSHRTIVSGGAKGIDMAAMRGALDEGGAVCGVLADGLEKAAMNRENRRVLLDGQLVLISPYDPSAGFNVGHAMQRNKIIYALADASLVVNSDFKKGGTWAGAAEQLDNYRSVPVFVRATGASSPGLDGLREKGAIPWPNPRNVESFEEVFDVGIISPQVALSLDASDRVPGERDKEAADHVSDDASSARIVGDGPSDSVIVPENGQTAVTESLDDQQSRENDRNILSKTNHKEEQSRPTPADIVFISVRIAIERILIEPMKETDVAVALDVSNAQAKAWLQRLCEEGVVEKKAKPVLYILAEKKRLFA